MQSSLRISKSTIYLIAFLFVVQVVNGFHAVRGGNYSAAFSLFYFFAFYWAIGWWFINDSREHTMNWIDRYMDIGLFLYAAWIFIIPYNLFKTRGWKAFCTLLIFLVIYIGAYFAGAIARVIIHLIINI